MPAKKGSSRQRIERSAAAVADRPLDRSAVPEPLPLPPEPPAALAPVTPEVLALLHARAVRSIGWELELIEGVLKSLRPGAPEAQSEHASRVIATLNKALFEIAAFTKPQATPANESDDDSIPADIDEFRNELARRIRGFIAEERGDAEEISGAADDA